MAKPLFDSTMLNTAILTFLKEYSSCHHGVLKEKLEEKFQEEIACQIAELVNEGKLKVDMNFYVKIAQRKN